MARAKRSAALSAEMRRSLIDTARAMIAERGLGAVTARGLAAELGWSVGTIYTVAPSIDAVTLEANAEELAELSAALESRAAEMSAAGAAPQELIRAFGEVYLRFATARPRSWAAIFERDAEGEPPEWYRARQARLFVILERSLRPLTRGAREARRSARTLWAALHGLLALALAGHLDRVSSAAASLDAAAPPCDPAQPGQEDDLEAHAQELIDVYLSGLAVRREDVAR